MDNKMLIGGEIVNGTCLVLFAAMDDELYRPAIALSISLDGGIATIDTLGFTINGPDSVKVSDADIVELNDVSLVKTDNRGYLLRYVDDCTIQAHTIDVGKAGWYDEVKIYERAGLTDWRDPKYARLRNWKHAWWRIVLDTFDLDMSI